MHRYSILAFKIMIFQIMENAICNTVTSANSSDSNYVKNLKEFSAKSRLNICSNNITNYYYMYKGYDTVGEGYRKNMILDNGTLKGVHLMHDFELSLVFPCPAYSYTFNPELDPLDDWTLFEVNHFTLLSIL